MTRSTHKPKVRARDVFRAYIREARRRPWLLLWTFVGAIGIQAADLISPIYLRQFFNLLALDARGTDIIAQLLTLVGILAVITAISWCMRRLNYYSILYIEAGVMSDLYASAFDYLIRHSHQFFISRFAGTLTRRVSKFAAAFETIFDAIAWRFFPTAFFAVGAVIVLFLRSHALGTALGIWLACFVALLLFVARLRLPLRAARAAMDSKMAGALADSIANQNTVALFSGAAHEGKLFRGVIGRWRAATVRSWNADEFIWAALDILMAGVNIGLLYAAVLLWQRGLLTVGDFVLIQVYLIGLFERLINLNRELRRFFDAYADASEMVEILEMPHEIQDWRGAAPLAVTKRTATFKSVGFAFPRSRPVLDNFNLTLHGGEKVALVGPSGAGKSTITKLLLRLYDITRGSILIDGQNIAAVPQDDLRNAIAFVPQEPILFHRTLMENIRYGRRDAKDTEVIAAAKKAHCHEFITQLPDGYYTYVGERGVKLSGGERQRVAIARAILKNAPILILDEATSSLDSESESLIQDALQALMEGKTVLVIAHRLSTIMKMDRIVVLEQGKIVAEGAHQNLLAQGGLYQKLWSIQAGGFRDTLPEGEPGDVREELTENLDDK
ncbi:MAG: ABC transporter ATP-binding protein [Candidatus Liptonbacteria bacterium]|nr:ABC transporter ATP-binding protein [Candidatus Liptonbacteria bacterium]